MSEKNTLSNGKHTLVVGIGNVLMGDEGIGVYVARELEKITLPPQVTCLDGGTGGFHLLDEFQRAARIIIIDATSDGAPPGTVHRLQPRFSSEYPPTLCAHDIGLKDLLDSLYLLGDPPEVTLFAISITIPDELSTDLSPVLSALVPRIAQRVAAEL